MATQTEEFVYTPTTESPSQASSISDLPDVNSSETCKDSLQLQTILPEHVWLIIAEKVIKKPNKQFQNFGFLCNSSPYFRKLLESKRVLYLFKSVFSIAHPWILATSEDDIGSVSNSDSDSSWETVDEDANADSTEYNQPELHDQKPISVIKSCRKVCHTWNFSIDRMIFEKVISSSKERLHSVEEKFLTNVEDYCFVSTVEIHKFLNFFKETHPKGTKRSRFVSKEVTIYLYCGNDDVEEDPGFPKAIEKLLDQYNDHIWSFAVYINGMNVEIENHVKFIKYAIKYVKTMTPRLKRLTLEDNALNDFGSLDQAIIEEGFQIEDISQYQLPHFPELVELTTSGLAVPIVQHLMQNNNKIKTLKVSLNPYGIYDIANLTFPNLVILDLNCWNMEQVVLLEHLDVPLTQLKFSYANGEFPDYSKIFDIIGVNWWETLTYLRMHLPLTRNTEEYVKVLDYTQNGLLFLPRLQTFELIIYQQFFLDFILPTSSSLKKLTIHQIHNPIEFQIPTISKRDKKKETIKFVSLEGRLRDSNIWELFPNLDYICAIGCDPKEAVIEELSRPK